MRIALDYDKTYTEDRELWDDFIEMAEKRGHDVWIVTMRYDNKEEGLGGRGKVIYTGRKAKKIYCSSKGIFFDIWIDDSPEWLFKNG